MLFVVFFCNATYWGGTDEQKLTFRQRF